MIRKIEELSLNAWPALQTMLHDGWLVRFSDGYSKRANSVTPIYTSCDDLNHKIAACENLFYQKNLDAVYKMSPLVQPENLDEVLQDKGYTIVDRTSVQVVELADLKQPSLPAKITEGSLPEDWFAHFCRLKNLKRHDQSVAKVLLSSIIPRTCFLSLCQGDTVVACGLGVLEEEYMGIFNIVTDPGYRNQGFGEQMVLHLLNWGQQNGAKYAYLQVLLDNAPALRLYQKLRFQELYSYCYRVKSRPRHNFM
jgi:ribosomal protein S18 acetylase RimI-like enzyme